MAISKIIYKANASATPETWMDATSATAAAANIIAPYTAMLADGVMTTGTGSGGGGGLEYETGTYIPAEDVASTNVTINFANSHSTDPILVLLSDAIGTYDDTTNTQYMWLFGNMYGFTGHPIYYTQDNAYYMQGYHRARATSTTSLPGASIVSSDRISIYISNSNFKPYYSQSYYYRTGHSYKWIAVWAPTA